MFENKKTLEKYKVNKTDEQWKNHLGELAYAVTRQQKTEKPFSGEYNSHKQNGIYSCICCGKDLFDSQHKYDSGTGWPSFYDIKTGDAVEEKPDNFLFMKRTEVVCSDCGSHLGHVFKDGPKPTNLRYCINSVALSFKQRS